MGNWRTGDPEASGWFLDDLVEWMETPEGQQSVEARDLVFGALENAGVDARQRKIIWDDGQRLSIEQSVERIHAGCPDMPFDQIEMRVLGWLESCAPESCSERELGELDELIEPWLKNHRRKSRPAKSSGELGTLKE